MKSKHLQLDKAKIPQKDPKRAPEVYVEGIRKKTQTRKELGGHHPSCLVKPQDLASALLSTSQPLKSAQSQQRQSHSPGVTGRTANLAKQKRFHVWRGRNC